MNWSRYAVIGVALVADAQQQQKAVNFYSLDKEVAMGAALAQEMDSKTTPLNSAAASAYVDRVSRELAGQIPGSKFQYVLTVVKDNLGAEPVALPGGRVYVSAGLFGASRNESQFAGLLAHAMAHVADRDATRKATRSETLRMVREQPALVGWPGTQAGLRSSDIFDRSYEQEADALAVKMMAGAGYDPSGLAQAVERVAQDDKLPGFPEFQQKRLAELRQAAAQVTVAPGGDGTEFARVRESLAK